MSQVNLDRTPRSKLIVPVSLRSVLCFRPFTDDAESVQHPIIARLIANEFSFGSTRHSVTEVLVGQRQVREYVSRAA
jgi:hypothetical protein